MGNRSKWSSEEDQILHDHYINNGVNFCLQLLKLRTKDSIKHRASNLGLHMSTFTRGQKNRKYTKEVLEPIVKKSYCYADLLRNLGVQAQAGNYTNIKKRIIEYNLDVSHFLSAHKLTTERVKKNKDNFHRKDILEYLTPNSTIHNTNLKKRLYAANLKQPICEMCGQDEMWRGIKISLILDHINGINNDNTLDNLRILCPNCNATLDTHCSKNRKIKTREIPKQRPRKVERPSLELLTEMVKIYSYNEIGRRFGVSDNAIRRWFKYYGVVPPKKHKIK